MNVTPLPRGTPASKSPHSRLCSAPSCCCPGCCPPPPPPPLLHPVTCGSSETPTQRPSLTWSHFSRQFLLPPSVAPSYLTNPQPQHVHSLKESSQLPLLGRYHWPQFTDGDTGVQSDEVLCQNSFKAKKITEGLFCLPLTPLLGGGAGRRPGRVGQDREHHGQDLSSWRVPDARREGECGS